MRSMRSLRLKISSADFVRDPEALLAAKRNVPWGVVSLLVLWQNRSFIKYDFVYNIGSRELGAGNSNLNYCLLPTAYCLI